MVFKISFLLIKTRLKILKRMALRGFKIFVWASKIFISGFETRANGMPKGAKSYDLRQKLGL